MQRTKISIWDLRRDSCTRPNGHGHKDTLRMFGEVVRNTRVHPGLHRGQHLQSLLEQRGLVNSEQYCEQHVNNMWQSSALVSPTNTLNNGLAPIGDDIEPMKCHAKMPR